MNTKILLAHGSGGRLTHELIDTLFVRQFANPVLKELKDSGVFKIGRQKLAMTTDSYVVDPIFFPGGDIGKLAVCGTVNDLAVSGAKPLFISAGFIIEEGLDVSVLKKVAESMKKASMDAGVMIVTGDTKVVEKGGADRLFINTSGIGVIPEAVDLSLNSIQPGDDIIISGSIGDHGISILSKREGMEFKTPVKSDCAALNGLISKALGVSREIRFMRDPTRGGVATILNEISGNRRYGIVINEENLPIRKAVKSACELLGLDPLYIANEGKVIIVCGHGSTKKILKTLKKHKLGRHGRVIGRVTREHKGRVVLKTAVGGLRLVDMPAGEQLPRIC